MTFIPSETAVFLGLATLLGSALTPDVRAKTEAAGQGAILPIGNRGWRTRMLLVGLIAGQPLWTLAAIAAVAHGSATRRFIFVMRKE